MTVIRQAKQRHYSGNKLNEIFTTTSLTFIYRQVETLETLPAVRQLHSHFDRWR